MVYCTRCGTQNPDNAANCSNCGAPLYSANADNRPYTRHDHHYDDRNGYHRGNTIAGLIIGIIILLIGFSFLVNELYGISLPWWPIIVIIIGIFLIARWFMWNRRKQ